MKFGHRLKAGAENPFTTSQISSNIRHIFWESRNRKVHMLRIFGLFESMGHYHSAKNLQGWTSGF
jgi:hypothetical protein